MKANYEVPQQFVEYHNNLLGKVQYTWLFCVASVRVSSKQTHPYEG